MNQHKRRICFAGLKTNVQPQAAHLCSSPSMNVYVAIGAHCVIPPVVEFLMLSYISCIVCILRLHLYLIGRDDRAALTIYKAVYCRQKSFHRLFYTTVSIGMFKFALPALSLAALASSVVGVNILLCNDDSWASANIRCVSSRFLLIQVLKYS